MSTLTIRLPDDKHERLKALAEARNISVNKLIDARLRFELCARRGNARKALAILDALGVA
jgi:predicted transcriptional regulator